MPKPPGDRWARRHDACVQCGTTAIPHRSRGQCKTCYNRLVNPGRRPLGPRGSFPQLTRQFLIEQYVVAGRSSIDIARQLGCTPMHVGDRLRRWGIRIRTRSEARLRALELGRIKGHRGVTTDPAFFDTWSPTMAYVLGLIATDGCLTPPKIQPRTGCKTAAYVSLTQADTEMLEKVQRLMGGAGAIYVRAGMAGHTVHTMGASRTYERLVHLGLTPRKSRTLRFPDVPPELRRHFVRGCWDGDGSIYIDRRTGRLKASFVTASKEFAESLAVELRAANIGVSRVYTETRGGNHNIYQLKLYREQDALALCRWMYDDVPEGQRLNRKYETYRGGLGLGQPATADAGGGVAVCVPPATDTVGRDPGVLGPHSGPVR